MESERAHAAAHAAIRPRVSGAERGRLLRPTDVARRLNVHRNTVYRDAAHYRRTEMQVVPLGGARRDHCGVFALLHHRRPADVDQVTEIADAGRDPRPSS